VDLLRKTGPLLKGARYFPRHSRPRRRRYSGFQVFLGMLPHVFSLFSHRRCLEVPSLALVDSSSYLPNPRERHYNSAEILTGSQSSHSYSTMRALYGLSCPSIERFKLNSGLEQLRNSPFNRLLRGTDYRYWMSRPANRLFCRHSSMVST
jgi:hypothetical protein